MGALDERDDDSGILALVKETASGFGQLVADHIRLARLEMTADAKLYVRDGAMVAICAVVLLMGYGLACIASGMALAMAIGVPLAFAALALLHMVLGGIALAVVIGRMKRLHLMRETKQEVSRSVSALTARSH
jgi:uncharacterized membrane protein